MQGLCIIIHLCKDKRGRKYRKCDIGYYKYNILNTVFNNYNYYNILGMRDE